MVDLPAPDGPTRATRLPAGTSMSPGTTGFSGGRPTPTPVVRLFSFLVEKGQVPVSLDIDGERIPVDVRTQGGFEQSASANVEPVAAQEPTGPLVKVPLVRLCYGRSGDKGDSANIGLIARKPEYLPVLRAILTEDRVAEHFAHNLKGEVTRYDLPGLGGVNFLLTQALGGGGMASLHTDNLAKAFAQVLLSMEVEVPAAWGLAEAA